MFKSFFLNRKYQLWSITGTLLILWSIWYKVEIDVKINQWFGTFYDNLQKILQQPNSVTFPEFLASLMDFAKLAGWYVIFAVVIDFFVKMYVFQWRTALNDYYVSNWSKLRHIEGASQRIQEDTMRFARIMETLGSSFLRSVLTLIAFVPLLKELGTKHHITELPWIGHLDHALVILAVVFSLAGTLLMAIVGIKLPGLEFNNQKVEAAYRKELVFGEDDESFAQEPKLKDLFNDVRKNYYRLYFHYMYFDVARWSYIQFSAIVPYLALGPSLLAGALTLGILQEIMRAFTRVLDSFQFLVHSWSTIVELQSIYKRLKAFETNIENPITNAENS